MIQGQVTLDIEPLKNVRKSGFRKALRIALNRSAAVVKASVVSHAESIKKTGTLAKSIRIKIIIKQASNQFSAVIGPSRSFKKTKGKYKRGRKQGEKKVYSPSRYSSILEFGGKRQNRKPFIGPAFAETYSKFQTMVNSEVKKELANLTNKN